MVRLYARSLLVAFVLSLTTDQVSLSGMLIPKDSRPGIVPAEPRPAPAPTPPIAPAAEPIAPAAEEDSPDTEPYYRVYRITAYCDRGTTAAGVPSGVGQCAAPADIPFGARIYIPELDRTFIVTDRTARRFRHNTVDLYIPDRADCKRFGCRYLECEITHAPEEIEYASEELRQLVAETGNDARVGDSPRSPLKPRSTRPDVAVLSFDPPKPAPRISVRDFVAGVRETYLAADRDVIADLPANRGPVRIAIPARTARPRTIVYSVR
jgi:3D (Asp-Asp-Asp) domain-containing protein